MSDNSKIEWTDATWNPVRGCSKVSPGCLHCYAETFAERFRGVPGHPFEFGFDLRLVPEKLGDPLRWSTSQRKIFVNSMSDLFHEKVLDEYIDQSGAGDEGRELAHVSNFDKACRADAKAVERQTPLCGRTGATSGGALAWKIANSVSRASTCFATRPASGFYPSNRCWRSLVRST